MENNTPKITTPPPQMVQVPAHQLQELISQNQAYKQQAQEAQALKPIIVNILEILKTDVFKGKMPDFKNFGLFDFTSLGSKVFSFFNNKKNAEVVEILKNNFGLLADYAKRQISPEDLTQLEQKLLA